MAKFLDTYYLGNYIIVPVAGFAALAAIGVALVCHPETLAMIIRANDASNELTKVADQLKRDCARSEMNKDGDIVFTGCRSNRIVVRLNNPPTNQPK